MTAPRDATMAALKEEIGKIVDSMTERIAPTGARTLADFHERKVQRLREMEEFGKKWNKSMTYSRAAECFGIDRVCQFVRDAFDAGEVIAIGPGRCKLEFDISKMTDIKFICVDPAPEEFHDTGMSKEMSMPIDYPTAQSLIEARPKLVGNCKVFINWFYAGSKHGHADLEAIDLLHPKDVVVIFDRSGASGSRKFFDWLYAGHRGYALVAEENVEEEQPPGVGNLHHAMIHFCRID